MQQDVAAITGQYHENGAQNDKSVTLDKVCVKLNGKCVTESVMQYFQNNETNIDKVAWDEYHFFEMGSYLDHFLSCTR